MHPAVFDDCLDCGVQDDQPPERHHVSPTLSLRPDRDALHHVHDGALLLLLVFAGALVHVIVSATSGRSRSTSDKIFEPGFCNPGGRNANLSSLVKSGGGVLEICGTNTAK